MNDKMATAEYRRILSKMCDICSKSEKCRSEIAEKLKANGIASDGREQILDFLIREKYIDEQRYAISFVRDKFRFNKWGKIKLAYMLRAKGVGSHDIDAALAEIAPEGYREALEALLQSKYRSLRSTDDYETIAKLVRFAQSHGFEAELAVEVAKGICRS